MGPSRIGKTTWARSLGHHIYWNSSININDWNENATYLVMDDMDINYLPNRKAWFGSQKTFTVTDKYKPKQTITFGKPLIWVNNIYPNLKETNENIEWCEWLNLNSIKCVIKKSLFK